MALIPLQWLSAVVALGVPGPPERWIATGFLYLSVNERTTTDGGGSTAVGNAYLVTNRHVADGQDQLLVRVNPIANAESARSFTLNLRRADGSVLWHTHPNAAIDVAVTPINSQALREAGMEINYFHSDVHALRARDMADQGVFEGDGVFVLGFPMAMVGGDRNVAIVRTGAIARVRDLMAGATDDFLVDAQVFPGNSGGPVVLRPEITAIAGTHPMQAAFLIGIVRSYVPYSDVAVSQQTGQVRVIFQENTGLASVHPVDCIDEAIKQHRAELPLDADPAEGPDEVPVD